MKPYSSYKHTGMKWIGEIPSGWDIIKIKWITSDHRQGYYSSEPYDDDGYKVVRITDLNDDHTVTLKDSPCYIVSNEEYERFHLNNGDFLFPRTGSIGQFGVYNSDTLSIYGSFLIRFRFNEIISHILIKYFLDSSIYLNQLKEQIHGGVNQNVHVENIKDCFITYPPLPEQKQIDSFLDHKTQQIDDLIEKTETKIELLQEKRTSLINHCVTKGLNPNVKMKDSGIGWIGKIPIHWELIQLKYLTSKVGSGITPRGGSDVYIDEGIPFLRSQNIHFHGLLLDDVVYISHDIHEQMSGSKVLPNDVLLNITGGSIGRCFYTEPNCNEYNVNQHVCIIRPNEKIITKFLYYCLYSNLGQIQVSLNNTGSGKEGLNFQNIKSFILTNVNKNEQQQIVDYLDEHTKIIDSTIEKETQRIELLKEYRQSLISEVVMGKIDVREWKQ